MFCANCGARLEGAPSLCPSCSTDPAVPMEEIDRVLSRLATAPRDRATTLLIRRPDEGAALGIAILIAVAVSVLLSGFTLGVFLLLLLLVLVRVRLAVTRYQRSAIDVRDHSDPRLYGLARIAFYRLRLPYQRVVVVYSSDLNAFTLGLWDDGVVVLHSELVKELTPLELLFIIGHEAAHVRCRHTTWLSLTAPSRLTRVPVASELLGLAFNGWSIKAEYSADRGGLLVARSLQAAVRALVRISTGEDLGEAADVGRFLSDAKRHDALATVTEHFGDHPFLYNRVSALVETAQTPDWQARLRPRARGPIGGLAQEAATP